MAVLPTITVDFREQADTAVARSANGILCVVASETALTNADIATYTNVSQVPASKYSTANTKAIKAAFRSVSPRKVIVIAKKTFPTNAELDGLVFSWIVGITDSSSVVSYVAAYNSGNSHPRKIKAVSAYVEDVVDGANDHVAVLANQTITTETDLDVSSVRVMIAAMMCACPITESVTYKAVPGIITASVPASTDGNYIYLVNDDGVIRIARGAFFNGSKIAVTEAKDIIREDVIRTFKNQFLGRKRNSAENQGLFCAAVLGYLRDLAKNGVINPDAEVSVEIDTDAMREAWEAEGVDVTGLTDAQVRAKPYKSTVFVVARCTILDVIEDLTFVVELG